MAALIYTLCQNVYKNIFYVHAINKINKNIGINYFLKQLLSYSNSKQSINNQLIESNTLTSNIYNKRNVYNSLVSQNSLNKIFVRYMQQNVRGFSSITPNPAPKPDPPKQRSLPPLMDFPEIVWPSIFKSVRNWILSTLIIAPYFDREFSLYDFVVGSKKAIEVVSQKISSGDFKELEGLVTNDAIDSISKSVSLLSLAQRQQLAIDCKDIYFSFPYQVGIMFDDAETSSQQKRFVEITMVYHVLQDLHLMRERGEEPPLNVGLLPEFRDKIHICNYRFIREFTKGVEDQWTINVINHFKPSDFL